MPLHPQAEALLGAMNELPLRIEPDTTVGEIRSAINELLTAAEPTVDLAHVEDRMIPGPHGDIPIRVYRPAVDRDLPVLVYYHGGGWVIGNVDTHDGVTRELANRVGCVVVSVDYRLAPEHPFPVPVDDCFFALEWVHAHAAELGADPERIAVGGDSAGGNLTAVVSLLARDAGGPPLVYQLMIYPVTDYEFDSESMRENAVGYFLEVEGMQWFYDHYLEGDVERAADWRVSPMRAANLRGLPPAMVITAEFDPLRDQGEAYANRLREAGNSVVSTRYGGMFHGFFGMQAFMEPAEIALDEAVAGLGRAFGLD
ncbi:MAG: alpha/beta hydrolase [Acidimicrobiia bacterium]